MRFSKSKYPVGATWKLEQDGRIGFIELQRRTDKMEVWIFGCYYSDRSGFKSDWATSYASAKRHHYMFGRFKRVKTTPD